MVEELGIVIQTRICDPIKVWSCRGDGYVSSGDEAQNFPAADQISGCPSDDLAVKTESRGTIFLNATESDRLRIAALLEHLSVRGFEVTAWPRSKTMAYSAVAITIWSFGSVHDELVVSRADQAITFARHVSILIDDTEPLIGFRQSQMIIAPEISNSLATSIEESLLGVKKTRPTNNPKIDKSYIDSVILAIISVLTVYSAFIVLSGEQPLNGIYINGFIIPSISAYLLLISIVRQPGLFLGKMRLRTGLFRLFALDAACQFAAYALASALIIAALMTDRRLLGRSGDYAPMLLAIMAAAYAAGLSVRWCIVLLMTRIKVAEIR
jgi:hypothetical protein